MITFKGLWENHPTINGDEYPCTTNGKKNFTNQCAIRLGSALAKCGVNTADIPNLTHCWHGHDKSLGHVIRAEELANALKNVKIAGIQQVIELDPSDFKDKVSGKTGIIFFKDYWQRTINGKKESSRNRSGDHIDLWNGSRMTDWKSWARIHMRIGSIGIHSLVSDWSDLEDSKEIWFWRVS